MNKPSLTDNEKRPKDPLINWTRPPRDDCPICLLPLPLDETLDRAETCYWSCCGTTICNGCILDQIKVDIKHGLSSSSICRRCPFCRKDDSQYDEDNPAEVLEREMKLANAGRHRSLWRVGGFYFDGVQGLKQDKVVGIKWMRRAAEAGSSGAANALGMFCLKGDGMSQDIGAALEWYQKAAELGRVQAFGMIGLLLKQMGVMDEAILNFRKAAICGVSDNIIFDELRDDFRKGYITKDEYAFTLRENQRTANEMKSESRDMHKKLRGA